MAQAAAIGVARPFVPQAAAPRRCRQQVVVAAAGSAQEPQQLARRSLLAGLAILAAAAPSSPSAAAVGRWDGQSSAIGSCALGEAGAECRQAILSQDKARFASYESMEAEAGKVGATQTGVAVADMSDAYVVATLALTDAVLAYAAFADPADPARIQVVKELKATMPGWVSKYARGGSVRKVSARKVYVVVDALSAHFGANGLAPLPASKLNKLVGDVQAARELLAEGK